MDNKMKKTIKIVAIVVITASAAYGTYRLYNFILWDVTKRIKTGVRQGVGSVINPFSWFKR